MPDDEELQYKLIALCRDFAQRLPEKIRQIDLVRNRLIQDTWDHQQADVLKGLLHKLAGAAGTFGYHKIGSAARQGETFLKQVLHGSGEPDREQKNLLDEGLARVVECCEKASKERCRISMVRPAPDAPARECSDKGNRLVFLVESNLELASELATHLRYYSYQTRHFQNAALFRKAMENEEPMAVISNIQLPDENGAEMIRDIQRGRKHPLAAMFISSCEDLSCRLQAVRGGGIAYFPTPVDPPSLVDTLDSLVNIPEKEKNRILIIDDSTFMAGFYSLVLEQAGMESLSVNDPMKIMEPLEEFRPDLILMDLYMPGCTGLELAQIIRQQEAFHSIPIVYLSVETNTDIQIAAMVPGGDEFLTKPIKPEHLVSVVDSRVRRARILRSYMVRDSLTGLFNHTLTKEYLSLEVEQARRRKGILSFAMIDIDNFKSVNDTYGHPVGDQVIKNLAQLLKQRVRKTDIIGRYGGEEFAVILPDTDASAAKTVMDELRFDFSKIAHRHRNGEFTVTISCGIAEFPVCSNAVIINETADMALYTAKNGGRNRVVVFGEKIEELPQEVCQ